MSLSSHILMNQLGQSRLKPLFDWYGAFKEKNYNYTCGRKARRAHHIALKHVQGKHPVRVVFLLIHESVWKYDTLYRLMENDSRYDPIIVVCPYTLFGDTIMREELQRTYTHFSARYQHVVSAWDEANQHWTDIKETLKPDLVFFTNPHDLTLPEYYIHHFSDTLTAYVQYSFHITHLNNLQYNQPFHNLIWKLFYETPFHARLAATYAANHGRNVVVTGYPGTDVFLDPAYRPADAWKPAPDGTKRIIWAPHHTIFENDSNLSYSTFLSYADYFLRLATDGDAPVQLAFKPHPALKAKLYNHPDWGNARTDVYYEAWKTAPRGQLEEGDYTDLFITSDAMVFDSASFMTEYLYTRKPPLFLVNDDHITERFNDFGKRVFEHLYHAYKQADIEAFLKTVVETGHDSLQEARNDFLHSTLLPPNNRTASENIYDYLNTIFV